MSVSSFLSRLSIAAVVLTASIGSAAAADNKIMEQPDSPIQITEFASSFGGRDDDYIIFEARYQNATDRAVIGIKFGFIAYDLFDESLGGVAGVDIDRDGIGAGAVESGRWSTRARGVAQAHETGIAYVQKVRFADGELWTADRTELQEKLEQLVPGGEVSLLGDEEQ